MKRLSFTLLFCFLVTFNSWGQAGIEVTVFNVESRTFAPDVPVSLSNPTIGFTAEQRTDDQGKARFSGLPTSGEYVVFIEQTEEFLEARSEPISLRSNFTRSVVMLRYPFRTVELEEVTVSATTSYARINTVNAEVSSTLSKNEVQMLPVEGRDLTRALYRLPNVTQATGFFPEAPNVSINGANALYTNYMIDGMDNNENFLGGQKFAIPIGIVQDITVLTNNYSTEFGRTGNGVFNITTRSGGNAFEGEAFYLTRPGPPLDASSPYAQRDLSGNQVKDGFIRHQGGFTLSGPLVKNKTFFLLNVEQTLDAKDNLLNVPQLNLAETIQGNNSFSYTTAKIDHQWNDRLRSSLRAHVGRVEIERQGGGLEGGVLFPSAANSQDRNSALVGLRNTFNGAGFFYEGNLQYSRFRWNYGRPESGEGPQVTLLDPLEQTIAILGHPGYIFDDLENTWQIQQKVTIPRGNHTFKIGVDLITANFELFGGGNVNGNYTVKLNQDQLDNLLPNANASLDITDIPSDVEILNYAVELQPSAFGTRQNMWSLYVEDLISVNPRLNLTVGLRYDFDSLSKGGASEGDLNNLAPRLNFNYTLDERSSLRGGYGIFYEKISYAIYSDALQQNSTAPGYRQQLQQLIDLGVLPADTDLDRITFDGNLTVNPDLSGITYLNGPTPASVQDLRTSASSNERRILNPEGYDNPYTHQFSFGYQHQLNQDMLVYVDLMHTQSYNLFRLRDLNSPSSFTITPEEAAVSSSPATLVRSPLEADATRPVAPVVGGARNIVVSESKGEAEYYAANFNVLKDRGNDLYAYRFSYTLSRLRNNTEDINFKAENANDFDAEWGPSINDRTHVFNGIFYAYPTTSLQVSLAGLVQSGQPINRIPDASLFGTTDLNGDGRSFGESYVGNSDRQPGETRNSDRLPWNSTFDLGVAYLLKLRAGTVELRADVFNLFNTENLSGYTNNATQSNQIQIGPAGAPIVRRNAAPPRQFQFGARYVF